jgi:hypothetical protein
VTMLQKVFIAHLTDIHNLLLHYVMHTQLRTLAKPELEMALVLS